MEQTLFAVVFPNGEILNCWTSPNRLYETKGAATRVLNQRIREAEELVQKGFAHWDGPERPTRIKRMASERQKVVDKLKTATVQKVVIVAKLERLSR